jgi:hypothetical protein
MLTVIFLSDDEIFCVIKANVYIACRFFTYYPNSCFGLGRTIDLLFK